MRNKDLFSPLRATLESLILISLLLVGFAFTGQMTPSLLAQTMFGDWTGVVSDSSGAAIPNAAVTLTNEATQAKRTATTDATGTYRLDGLLIGTYTIECEAPRFKKYEQTGIAVGPAMLKRVDVTLEVGTTKETVEVRGVVPAIETESPALTTGIPKIATAEKPLMNETRQGYTFDQLEWAPASAAGQTIYSIAGNLPSMEQTNLEGVQHSQFRIVTPPSAIGEVSVVMSNAPAEYARPVTMDATFRGGSNRFTGEYWMDLKNPCTDARNDPFTRPPTWPCPSNWRYAWVASGPVYLPKIYDGRNKTFFFFTYARKQPSNISAPGIIANVPTLAMQGGDFSKYPKTIIDPITGQPFSGNVIPPNRISQFAKGVINDFYGSKYTYLGGPDNYTDNGIAISQRLTTTRQFVMKFDHNQGTKDILSGSYFRRQQQDALDRNNPVNYTGAVEQFVKSGVGNNQPMHVWSMAHTHTFSANIVNQLRLGVTRYVLTTTTIQPGADISKVVSGPEVMQSWGLQGITPPNLSGLPQFSITNWEETSNDNESFETDTRYSGYDNISFNKGHHTLKMGFSAVKLLDDGTAKGPYFGSFAFNGLFTGEPWADFLLGLPATFQRYQTRSTIARRSWEYGAFIQDDFRVNSRLTLFYGLRYDEYTAPYDKNDMYYNFDPKTLSMVVPDAKAASLVSPAWPSQTFPIKLASAVGFPGKLTNGTKSVEPRFGFAYKLGPKMVLRGGYGVYTGAVRFNALQTTGPFAITENFINQTASGTTTGGLYALPNPFPATAATATVASATGVSPNYRSPYSQNWNLTLEREVMKNWGVRATYRGVKSTQLLWQRDLNAVRASTTSFSQSRRPYPGLQNLNFIENGANDNYHAMMLELTHPWASGVYMTAAYTLERSGTTSPGGVYDIDQTASSVEYSYNRQRDYGPHVAYPTQDFIMNFVDDLPVGNGKRFARSPNKVLNALIGNWTFVGSFSWRSGWFFTPFLQGVDPGNLGITSNRRPDRVPGCDPYAGARDIHGLWFNPKCYTVPAAGQLGNVGVNSLVGPGAWVFNLNPFKEFPLSFIREGTKLRFGANIYDLLNHPAYNIPTNNLNSAVAGVITSTQFARAYSHDYAGQRQMVIDMRVIF